MHTKAENHCMEDQVQARSPIKEDNDCLERLQGSALELVFEIGDQPYKERLHVLGLTKLKERRIRRDLIKDGPGIEVVLYAPPFFQRLQEFRRKELFTDLYIQCGSEFHFVHSSVLAAACPPICLLLEESQAHSEEDKYNSTGSPKPPYGDVIDEELEVNSVFSEAHTGFGKERKIYPCISKQFDEVKVLGDDGNRSTQRKECFVLTIPIKDAVDSHITLSLSNNVTGVWNLSVQGIEPRVMNCIIHFVYWEKFIAAKACIHNFISTARSLQLLGCESVCGGLQFVTPGEIRYFGVHDENKTLDSSFRIGASYIAGASNKAGSSSRLFAHDDVEVKQINPLQELRKESKVESSNISRWKNTKGQNDSVLRQERENKVRNCTILSEDDASRAKNFAVLMPSVKETEGRNESLWRPYEIKLETVISKQQKAIKAKTVEVSGQERDTKARNDCFPRQEGEIKTKNDTGLTHPGENKVESGPFLRQVEKTKDGNDIVPKQEYTKPDISKWEENTEPDISKWEEKFFSRWEANRVENYSLLKHEKSKDFMLSLEHGVLDNMNFPHTSRDTSKDQKCLSCPRGIYSNHSCYSHEVQNPHHTLEVGPTTGSQKICNRENSLIHNNALQEGIVDDVTFSLSQILDIKRKGTHQKSNLILRRDMFNRNIAELLSRSCNKDRVQSLMCTIQKMQGKKGLRDMEDCNDTERKDNSTLKFNDTTVHTEKSIGESCIIDALQELHYLMEGESLLTLLDSNICNAKASGKSKFSKYVSSCKPTRPVRKSLVHNEHSYCKLQTAVAVKILHGKVSHSSNCHKISYKSSNTGTRRVDIGSDATTTSDWFHYPESKKHSTYDLQDQILEYEGNQESNEDGFHNTHLQMVTNAEVQRTYETEQRQNVGQDKEKLTVEEEKPERGSRYRKSNCNLHWTGGKKSEPNRNTDYLMYYKQNSSACANQGLNIPDYYRHKFKPPNQEDLLCSDLSILKFEDRTNCMTDIPKQARCCSFGKTDVQEKVWTDKMAVECDRKLHTEVNNHSKGDEDYRVESWNTLMKDANKDIMEIEESGYKIRNFRKNKKVKVRRNLCVDRERERDLKSKEETVKGIFKNMLQTEKATDQVGYQQRGTVSEVKLNWFKDQKGKSAHGDFLNCRFGNRKRRMQGDNFEDGKEVMPVRKYDHKCSPFGNHDKKMRPIEGLGMKDPLIEDISLKNQLYDHNGVKLKECNIKFPIVESKGRKDQFVDKDSLKALQGENVLQDAIDGKNCLQDHTLKQGLRKDVGCEFDFDVRSKDGRVEVVHDDFKKGNLIDTHTKMINFRRREKQSQIESNEQIEPKVDEIEFEKRKIDGRYTLVGMIKSRVKEVVKGEPQVEEITAIVGDQYEEREVDGMSTKLEGFGGTDVEHEIKNEEVEVEDFSHNHSDSQVRIKNCYSEDCSKKKLGLQETMFSISEFTKDEVEVVISDQSADKERKTDPKFVISEVEGDGEGGKEGVNENLDEAPEYSTDFQLKTKLLEKNFQSSSQVAPYNNCLEAGDREKVVPQEILFSMNKYIEESHHKFSLSLELRNTVDYIDKRYQASKKVLDLVQEVDATSLEDEDSYSYILKPVSLQNNPFLKKFKSQNLVSDGKDLCKNSEVQKYGTQSQIQMPVDALARMEDLNSKLTKKGNKLVLKEVKRFEELLPLSNCIPKPRKDQNRRCPRRKRRKRKIQIKKQKSLKNPLFLEQKSDDLCVNKAVEDNQQNKHNTQSTVAPSMSSYMHYSKLSEKCLKISSSSCSSKSCTKKVIEEDFTVDDELLSHFTWGKFEEEVEYVVVGDDVNSVYTEAAHSCLKTVKKCNAEAGLTSVGKNEEVFAQPKSPGSVTDFTGEHSYPVQLDDENEHTKQTPLGRRKKGSFEFCHGNKRLGDHPNRLQAYVGRSGDNSTKLHCWKENNLEESTEGKVPFESSKVQLRDAVNYCPNMHVGTTNGRDEKDLEERNMVMLQERNGIDKSWSIVTNCENTETDSSQNSAWTECTVEVGAVSVKVREYSFADCLKSRVEQEMPLTLMLSDSIIDNFHVKEREQVHDTVGQRLTVEGILRCLGCPNMFASLKALTSHYRETHMENKFFMYCPVVNCSARIANNKMDTHIKNHVVSQKCRCPYCSFSTATPSSLGRHITVHKQNGFPLKVQEHHSRTPYHQKRALGGGLSGLKTSSYVFEEFREETSTSESAVAEGGCNGINDASTGHHKQYDSKMPKKMRVGNGIPSKIEDPVGMMQPLHCCSETFSTVKALMQHIIWYHKQGQECVPCFDPACPVMLWTSNMDSHLRCHAVQGEFKCQLCTYSGRNAAALRIHTSAHRRKAVQKRDGPSGQRHAVKHMRPENLFLQNSSSCAVSHEIMSKNDITLQPLCSHAEHSKRLNMSSCHKIDKTSQTLNHHKGLGKGKNSSVYQVEKFGTTKISASSDYHSTHKILNKSSKNESKLEKGDDISTSEDFSIEKERKAVSCSSESIRKVKFFSLTQRGKKEKLSCLGSKVEKKKNIKAIQKWKLSQTNIMLMNYSQRNNYKSVEKKDNMNTKVLTKGKIKGFNRKSRLVKECWFNRGKLVKETNKNTDNIKKLHSCIPIKSNYNEAQKKVDKSTLSEILVNEEKDVSSSVEIFSTAENAINLFSNSLNVGLKRHMEETDGLDTGKSQLDMKVQVSRTQSSNYTCPLCVDYFDTPDRLFCHYICQHAYHSPYICKFEGCPVLLKKRDSWRHLIGHLYKKSFRCHLCSYSHHSIHMLRHHLFCHSQVIQELEQRDEFYIKIQGPSGDTEILLSAESVRKRFKRKFSLTRDNRIASKRKKEDVCHSAESTPILEGQNMMHLAFESCMP